MAKKRKPGRPVKLGTDAQRKKILALIRTGYRSLEMACAEFGIDPSLFYRRRREDAEFDKQVRQAVAIANGRLVELNFRHAEKDPRTAMHLLACRVPEYRKPEEVSKHLHAHAHADVPPRVIFEIIDKRPAIGTDPAAGPSSPSGFLEQ